MTVAERRLPDGAWLARLAFSLVVSVSSTAVASLDTAEPEMGAESGVFAGPVLPETLAPVPSSYFVVGVVGEHYGDDLSQGTLLGLEAQYRWRALGPNLFLESRPQAKDIADARYVAGLGFRGYFPLLSTEFSYGFGFRFESRLAEDFWLAHATPLELGAVIYSRHSWEIQLFVGVTRVMGGHVIDWFLINPNGIDNQAAKDEVSRLSHEAPWLGFARIVFGRRLD